MAKEIKRFQTGKKSIIIKQMAEINEFLFSLEKDMVHSLERHSLDEGEEISLHSHPNMEEWVIFVGRAKIDLIFKPKSKSQNKTEEIEMRAGVTSIYIPPGITHGLKVKSPINYLVFKHKIKT